MYCGRFAWGTRSHRPQFFNQPKAFAPFLAFLIFTLLVTSVAHAADVMRVEEDWELVLDQPSGTKNAPQLETAMSPFGRLDSQFGRISWNYQEQPEFFPGGLQLQGWDGGRVVVQKTFDIGRLETPSETLTWTQRLETDGSHLRLTIVNGHSTTWGAFGGDGMSVSSHADLPNLNGYRPDVSADNSMITYGANRVSSLRIKQIRLYGDGDVILTVDTTSRSIHP